MSVTVQCQHQVRGPKRGRIYVYDAKQCQRTVTLKDGVNPWQALCWQHERPQR